MIFFIKSVTSTSHCYEYNIVLNINIFISGRQNHNFFTNNVFMIDMVTSITLKKYIYCYQ